jgi:hypothetical protein
MLELTLPLLMPSGLADDMQTILAPDDFAISANLFD